MFKYPVVLIFIFLSSIAFAEQADLAAKFEVVDCRLGQVCAITDPKGENMTIPLRQLNTGSASYSAWQGLEVLTQGAYSAEITVTKVQWATGTWFEVDGDFTKNGSGRSVPVVIKTSDVKEMSSVTFEGPEDREGDDVFIPVMTIQAPIPSGAPRN